MIPLEKSSMSNAQIDLCINEISNGDRLAVKKLYDEFNKPIFLFALSIVKDFQIAEDVLQETFLNIMASAATYRLGTNPKAWIYSIARNACLLAIKKLHSNILVDLDDIENIAEPISLEDKLTGNSIDTLEAFNILDDVEKEIVALYVFGKLRQSEVSNVLRMPYIKVRSRYAYAIKKLKKYYSRKVAL
jgi:RNA polymerase sigma-70 factor (ECF subfamily)